MTRAKDISKILTDADISGTLDVTGVLSVGEYIRHIGDTDTQLRFTTDTLQLYVGNNENLTVGTGQVIINQGSVDCDFRVESNGNANMLFVDGGNDRVGVGTNSPARTVQIVDSSATPYLSIVGPNDSGAGIMLGDTDDETVGRIAYDNSTNALQFWTNDAERMRIDSSGRLLLGTTTEGNVSADNLTVSGDGNVGMTIRSTNSSETAIYFSDGTSSISEYRGFILYKHADDSLRFGSNGTDAFRVLSNNDIAINSTTTSTSGLSSAHLKVGTNASKNSIIVESNRQNQVAYGIHADGSTGIRYAMYILNGGGGEVGKISYTSTAVTYATTSDHRVKESITYDFDATTRLKQLKPCRFNFISDETNTLVDGFLAHEAQAVVPECVTGTHNEVDADGNAVMQGIDQSKIVPLLTKTILELEARITALEGA